VSLKRDYDRPKNMARSQVVQKNLKKKLTHLLNLPPRVLDFLGLDLWRRRIETAEFVGFFKSKNAGGEGLVGGSRHFVFGDGGEWGESGGVGVGGCDLWEER
jgi:hypothetical protein